MLHWTSIFLLCVSISPAVKRGNLQGSIKFSTLSWVFLTPLGSLRGNRASPHLRSAGSYPPPPYPPSSAALPRYLEWEMVGGGGRGHFRGTGSLSGKLGRALRLCGSGSGQCAAGPAASSQRRPPASPSPWRNSEPWRLPRPIPQSTAPGTARRPAAPHPCPDPGTTPPGGAATSAYARTPQQLQVPARLTTPRAGGRWNAQAGRCLPLLASRFSELIF